MIDGFDPDDLIDDVVVVLLAAGSGQRLGSPRPKAFVGLGGRVMLAHSLEVLDRHEAVDSIVLVVPDGWVEPAEVMVDDLGCDRVSTIEVGGDSRAASVLAGLQGVPDRRQTAVLVHDAARPFLHDDLIDRVLAPLAEGYDAVAPALPAIDTVKRVDPQSGAVLETLPREQLRLTQTPQACRASTLRAALEQRASAGQLATVTDCAHAIELAGGRTLTVAGDERTGKITTADDLRRFEAQLAGPETAATPTADTEAADDAEEEHADDLEPLDELDLAGSEQAGWDTGGGPEGHGEDEGSQQ